MADKADTEEKDAAEETTGGGGKRKKLILVVVVLLLAGAGWFFFLRGGDDGPVTLPPPVAGDVVQLEPITINLAGGHFLKFGMALQPTADAASHGKVNGAQALDLAIDQFSGMPLEELATTDGRHKAKEELLARIKLAYLPHDAHAEEKPAEDGKASSDEKSHAAGAEPEVENASETGHAPAAAGHSAPTTGKAAIAEAAALTVQPLIYDLYITEFVMQ